MTQEPNTPLEKLVSDLGKVFRAKLATQEQISEVLGIAQSTVSKAKRGELKRVTADTLALQEYANILLLRQELPVAVHSAAVGFLSAGGSEDELIDAIKLTTRLVRGRRAS